MNVPRWAVVIMLLGVPLLARAETSDLPVNRGGRLGLGIAVGQPMGLTGKLWLSEASAVDAFTGYHFNHNFDAHVDYLWHSFALTRPQANGTLPLYAGLGARLLAGDDPQFGLRVPLGVEFLLPRESLEFFAELAPVVTLSNFGADIDGQVGLRLYAF